MRSCSEVPSFLKTSQKSSPACNRGDAQITKGNWDTRVLWSLESVTVMLLLGLWESRIDVFGSSSCEQQTVNQISKFRLPFRGWSVKSSSAPHLFGCNGALLSEHSLKPILCL